MFTYARTRRAALLFLFLALSLAGTMGAASAMIPPPPDPIATPDADGRAAHLLLQAHERHQHGELQPQGNHRDVAVSSDAGLQPWVLICLAVALVAAGVVMVALRRHGRTHRAELPSS
jgi:hypothetical protein